MSYSVTIHTGAYKPFRENKRNLGRVTINHYMELLNGWHSIEPTLTAVKWRICLFRGERCYGEPMFEVWYAQPHNVLEYYDYSRGTLLQQDVSAYGYIQGFEQGEFDIEEALMELENKGKLEIPFKWLYIKSQYLKNMDGCYMEIVKVSDSPITRPMRTVDIYQNICKENPATLVSKPVWGAFEKAYKNRQCSDRDIDLYILGEFKKCYNAIVHEFDLASVRHGWNDIFKKEYIHQKVVAQGNQIAFQGLVKTGYVRVSGTGYTFQNSKISLTQTQIERLAYIHRILDAYLKA